MDEKLCPKCKKQMIKDVQFGDEKRPYAIDVWACNDCNYIEPIEFGVVNEDDFKDD